MPPKGKAKNAPNQHDKRHESGLAPPGKRVVKQRSNGHLNGLPNGKPITPPALPSTGLNQGFKFPRPADSSSSSSGNSTDTAASATSASAAAAAAAAAPATPAACAVNGAAIRDHAEAASLGERERTASDASVEETGLFGESNMHEMVAMQLSTEGQSVAAAGAGAALSYSTRASRGHGGPFSTVSTILAYYPLRDAISILILLLSLPPTLVLVIQTLFASLTFVPPTAGLSLSTLPNIKEMFNSSNFGYPAMATILIVDLVFWVLWLPVWKPVQNIFLDLSQAVIAVSLSGAAAGTGAPTYSIATCTFIVCIVHVLRYKAIHLTALDYLRSVLHKMDIGFDFDAPSLAMFLPPPNSSSVPPIDRGWAVTVIRTILGIHIVSQGVTTCIRRSLVQANERDQGLPAVARNDTEATAGAEATSRTANGSLADASPTSHVAATSTSSDGRTSGLPTSQRENRSRESRQKKRKQANQVRSQQPLWAAIASTKVTFVKEMEQRDAVDDAREAAAMDSNAFTSLTNISDQDTDRIWICEVRDTEVSFLVELSPESAAEKPAQTVNGAHLRTGIDKSKPFYVRINGAAWSSTRITPSLTNNNTQQTCSGRFSGEIFGLAPLGTYLCEIMSMADQSVLCSVGLVTQPAPTAEQAASVPAQAQHQALRPSSPITTLRQSIQSAEAKLNDVRNRTKKTKKDQRAAHADIKREINNLKSKLDTSAGTDDKQERRLMQFTQHKNQAEEATTDLKKQIEALGEVPEDEIAAHEAMRQRWQASQDARDAAISELDEAQAEHDRELGALRSEISTLQSKKEKLTARNVQRAQEIEKLIAKQHADLAAKQKRDSDRAQALQEREKKEAELRYHISVMDAQAQGYTQKAQEAWQQVNALANWGSQPPLTPEGIIPNGAEAFNPQANGFSVSAFGSHQAFNPPFHAAQPQVNPHPGGTAGLQRGRSSSMLSQYSGFTDNGEDFTFGPSEQRHQHTWPIQGDHRMGTGSDSRKGSDGDGSRNGSGDATMTNGSASGSNSPRPAVGTIGPPSKKPLSPVAGSLGVVGSGR